MQATSLSSLITSSLLLLLPTIVLGQTVPAPVALKYEGDKLQWNIEATSLAMAQGFIYKQYDGINNVTPGVVIQNVTCEGTTSPFTCKSPSPNFAVGHNILQITATNGVNTEGPKSEGLALFYATAVKETIINTEQQSVIKCQPGTFEMQRITLAADVLPKLNATTKHVAYMFATATAVYIISCTLLPTPGT